MELDFATTQIRRLGGTKFDPVVVVALETSIENGKLRLNPSLVEV